MSFDSQPKSLNPRDVALNRRSLWYASLVFHRLLKAYASLRVGATKQEKRAYNPTDAILFTFDDYGTEAQVKRLLAILRDRRVRAMFFLQGDWAERNPSLLRAIDRAGHIIGNHTYSHAVLPKLSGERIESEIKRGPKSRWLRPPEGRYNRRVRDIAHKLGMRICYWTIDSDDWQGVPPSYIMEKVLAEVCPRSVILFHIHADATADALPGLIDAIRARGLRLDSPRLPRWEDQS